VDGFSAYKGLGDLGGRGAIRPFIELLSDDVTTTKNLRFPIQTIFIIEFGIIWDNLSAKRLRYEFLNVELSPHSLLFLARFQPV
jgi:hypothetical protein